MILFYFLVLLFVCLLVVMLLCCAGNCSGYRMSKAAVNIAGMSLARDLKPRGIAVAMLHPGYVRTGMTQGRGSLEPAESAAMLVKRIHELSLETTGSFLHANGDRLPW